jgi:hypothetical protein
MPNRSECHKTSLKGLSESERDALIQDWVDWKEIECELQLNPLSRLEAQLECELGPHKISYWYRTEPDTDAITDLAERAKALRNVVRWICVSKNRQQVHNYPSA